MRFKRWVQVGGSKVNYNDGRMAHDIIKVYFVAD